MARPHTVKQPHELIGSISRLVGWVQISPLPPLARAELLLNLGRCTAILAGLPNGQIEAKKDGETEAEEDSEEAPPSQEKTVIP